MEPSDPFFPGWVIALIVGLFLIIFPAIWCFVCFLISAIGGWGRLAKRFATEEVPKEAVTKKRVSGRVGVANYNRVLTLHFTKAGFFMEVMPLFRMGHPRLFIPWSEVSGVHSERFFGIEMEKIKIGDPTVATLYLRKDLLGDEFKPA